MPETDRSNDVPHDPCWRLIEAVTRGDLQRADARIRAYLEPQSSEQLIALVWELIDRLPEVRVECLDRIAQDANDTEWLVSQTRCELEALRLEAASRSASARGEAVGDFGGVKARLERLVQMQASDQVLTLAPEILTAGFAWIEATTDDYATYEEIRACMHTVLKAADASLAPADRTQFLAKLCAMDSYGVLDDELLANLREKDL